MTAGQLEISSPRSDSSRDSSPEPRKLEESSQNADFSPLDEEGLSLRLRQLLTDLQEQVSRDVPTWPQSRGCARVPEFYFDPFTEELVTSLERYFYALMEVRLESAHKRLTANTHDYLAEVVSMRNRLTPGLRKRDVQCTEEELYVYEPLMYWPEDQQAVMRLIIEERLKQLLNAYREPIRMAEAGVQAGSPGSGEDPAKLKAKNEKLQIEVAKISYEKKLLEDRVQAMEGMSNNEQTQQIVKLQEELRQLKDNYDGERLRATRLGDELMKLQNQNETLEVKLHSSQEETKELEWKRLEREAQFGAEVKRLEEKVAHESRRRSSTRVAPPPQAPRDDDRARRQEEERYKKVQTEKERHEEMQRKIEATVEKRVEEIRKKLEEEYRKKSESESRERLDKETKKRVETEVRQRMKEEAKKASEDVKRRIGSAVSEAVREHEARRKTEVLSGRAARGMVDRDEDSNSMTDGEGVNLQRRATTASTLIASTRRDTVDRGSSSKHRLFDKLHDEAEEKEERRSLAHRRRTLAAEQQFLTNLEAKTTEGQGRLSLVVRKGLPSKRSVTTQTEDDDSESEDGEDDDDGEQGDGRTPASPSQGTARKRQVSIADDARRKSKPRKSSTKLVTPEAGAAGGTILRRSLKGFGGDAFGEDRSQVLEQPETEPTTLSSPRRLSGASSAAGKVAPLSPAMSTASFEKTALRPVLASTVVSNTSGVAWRTLTPAHGVQVDIGPAVRCVSATSMVPSNISKKATSPKAKRFRELKKVRMQASASAPKLSQADIDQVSATSLSVPSTRPHSAA
mmetsp:Transcript_25744/g.60092  ORF Transcript_25744/g.60092 Transcript_25744/m.60092 type:complete len:797 (+) Transcript_25744:127-2517(+)